jgi:hypothetical protein
MGPIAGPFPSIDPCSVPARLCREDQIAEDYAYPIAQCDVVPETIATSAPADTDVGNKCWYGISRVAEEPPRGFRKSREFRSSRRRRMKRMSFERDMQHPSNGGAFVACGTRVTKAVALYAPTTER